MANVEDLGCCEVNGTAVNDVCGGLPHLRKYDFLNIVKKSLLISIFIALNAGLCNQIVKYTGKHRMDIAHVLKIIVLFKEQFCLQSESSTPY